MIPRRQRTIKLTTMPIVAATPVFNPSECEGMLFVSILLETSTLGLNGNDTIGLPPGTVSLVGGRGKGARDVDGPEVRVDCNVDKGGIVE